jgi:hypothetical protein
MSGLMIPFKILFPAFSDHQKSPITDIFIAISGVVRRCVVISLHVTRVIVELKIARTCCNNARRNPARIFSVILCWLSCDMMRIACGID